MLFTGKQHCLQTHFSGDVPIMNICFHAKNLKFGYVMVLAVLLFNKIKQNMKKHVSLYFPDVMSKYIYFG